MTTLFSNKKWANQNFCITDGNNYNFLQNKNIDLKNLNACISPPYEDMDGEIGEIYAIGEQRVPSNKPKKSISWSQKEFVVHRLDDLDDCRAVEEFRTLNISQLRLIQKEIQSLRKELFPDGKVFGVESTQTGSEYYSYNSLNNRGSSKQQFIFH